MRYDVILMDIDNTLLDFRAGTREGLTGLLGDFGLALTPAIEARFHEINDSLWTAYEHGEIEKDAIFPTRFSMLLGELGIDTDPLAANERYAEGLRQSAVLMPQCMELLNALHGRCRLAAVTNGVTTTQEARLKKAGFLPFFEKIFISEAMGTKKPEKAFFDQVFAALAPVDRSRCIILGDSLTSDMQGGRNAQIATCCLGKGRGDPRCDYVIDELMELVEIVEGTGECSGPERCIF